MPISPQAPPQQDTDTDQLVSDCKKFHRKQEEITPVENSKFI